MQNKLAKGQIYGQLNGLRLPLKFIIIYACMHLNTLPFIRLQIGHLRLLYSYNSNIMYLKQVALLPKFFLRES